MKCTNCGAEFEDGTLFCPKCGKEVQWVPEYHTLETILRQKELMEQEKKKKELEAQKEKERQQRKAEQERKKKRQKNIILEVARQLWFWLQALGCCLSIRLSIIHLTFRWHRQTRNLATRITRML